MNVFIMIIVGVVGGILGGMGMGGGTLLIPLLTVFGVAEQKIAQSINLIAFVPMSAFVCIMHAKNKLIDASFLWLSVPALIASVVASFIATDTSPVFLRVGFGIFLSVLGIFQLITTIIKRKKDKEKGDK